MPNRSTSDTQLASWSEYFTFPSSLVSNPADSGHLYSRLDVLPIVLRAQVPAFAKDLFIVKQAHLASSNSQPSNNALEADDVFQLYKTIHKLADLYKAFVPG
jgi:hypothetical protein